MNRILKVLLSILMVVALPASAAISVVTGNVADVTGTPASLTVTFKPLSTPQASSPTVFFGSTKTATSDSSGDFTISLIGGNYQVTVGTNAANSFVIAVPNTVTTNNWTSLITTALTYTYPYSATYVTKAGLSNFMSAPIYYNGPQTISTQLVTKGYVDAQTGAAVPTGTGLRYMVAGVENAAALTGTVNGQVPVYTNGAIAFMAQSASGGGGGTVGTMVNSGATVSGTIPTATDLTGTNYGPSKVTVSSATNLLAGRVTGTNAIIAPYATASRAAVINSDGIVSNSVTTMAELAFVNGVTSGIQGQFTDWTTFSLSLSNNATVFSNTVYAAFQPLDADLTALASSGSIGSGAFVRKTSPTISGLYDDGATITIGNNNNLSTVLFQGALALMPSGTFQLLPLTANRALALDGTKNIVSSATTATELGYVSGVTSALQTQLDNKQPLSSALTTWSLLSPVVGATINTTTTAAGDIAAYSSTSKTNLTVATSANIAAALGQIYQSTNANSTTLAAGGTAGYVLTATASGVAFSNVVSGAAFPLTANGNSSGFSITNAARYTAVVTNLALTGTTNAAIDASTASAFRVLLTQANVYFPAPSNGQVEQAITVYTRQDATGYRTCTFATNWIFGTDITAITLSTNKMDIFKAIMVDPTNNVWAVTAFVRGYAQ